MKNILILASIFIFSIAACAQKQDTKSTTKNKKAEVRNKTEPLKVGETAPDFSLNDQNGKKVVLSETKNPVILVFYRGYW